MIVLFEALSESLRMKLDGGGGVKEHGKKNNLRFRCEGGGVGGFWFQPGLTQSDEKQNKICI